MKPAVVRTVELLGAQRKETRSVHGFEIERGIPMRETRYRHQGAIVEVLESLDVGESFQHTHPCKDQRRVVQAKGLKRFAAQSTEPKKWRIWRTR